MTKVISPGLTARAFSFYVAPRPTFRFPPCAITLGALDGPLEAMLRGDLGGRGGTCALGPLVGEAELPALCRARHDRGGHTGRRFHF